MYITINYKNKLKKINKKFVIHKVMNSRLNFCWKMCPHLVLDIVSRKIISSEEYLWKIKKKLKNKCLNYYDNSSINIICLMIQ